MAVLQTQRVAKSTGQLAMKDELWVKIGVARACGTCHISGFRGHYLLIISINRKFRSYHIQERWKDDV